jgi:hypothetical protein
MKRSIKILAIIFMVVLVIGGIGCKEGSAQEEETGIVSQPEAQKNVVLTGIVHADGTFEAEDGETYLLTDTEKNAELQDLAGETVKVKAVVMENDEGAREISVISFEQIQE